MFIDFHRIGSVCRAESLLLLFAYPEKCLFKSEVELFSGDRQFLITQSAFHPDGFFPFLPQIQSNVKTFTA